MYSALYRKLRGGKFLKTLQMIGFALAFVALLFFVIFPLVEPLFTEDPSING